MRVATYLRVSSEDQVERFGLAGQRTALQQLAVARGYEIVEEVRDEGISGTVEHRPGLDHLRDLLGRGAVQGVIVYDLSRLARDVVLCLRLLKELQQDLHAVVEFVNFKLDDTPEGEFMATMQAGAFQLERRKLMQRTADGRRAKAHKGIVPGAPYPFGYAGDKNVPGGLRVIEHEAKVVRDLFTWAAEGTSLREMVRRLDARAIRTRRGQPFNKATLAKMLRNLTYRGEYVSHRTKGNPKSKGGRTLRPETEWIKIPVQPIVTAATFEKAQATFSKNLTVGRIGGYTYLLKRLLFCGACGRRYVGDRSHGRPGYRCTGRDSLLGDQRCRARTLRAETVEAEIKATIRWVLDDPDLLFNAAERHHRRIVGRQIDVQREVDVVRREQQAVQRRRANLLDLAVDGGIPKATFVERDAPMAAEEDRLTRRLAKLTAEATSSAVTASKQRAVVAHAKLLRRGLDRLDVEGWRDFLVKLVEKIVVQPTTLELHLLIPSAQVASQRSNQASSNSSTLARAEIGSFSSSW